MKKDIKPEDFLPVRVLYESDELFSEMNKLCKFIPLSLLIEILKAQPEPKFELIQARSTMGENTPFEKSIDITYARLRKHMLKFALFDLDGNFRVPLAGGLYPVFLTHGQPCSDVSLCGRLGVHCFNFQQGRKLQYLRIPKYNIWYPYGMTLYITVEVKDLADDSPHTFQTLTETYFAAEHYKVSTIFCRIKPETPEDETVTLLDDTAVDEFYKGCMPDFVSEIVADDDDKLRFYEVQEQDISEYDWLLLYTDFALKSYWRYNDPGFYSNSPAEMKKIIVETCEPHTEPRLKLKSSNAIFHISFTAKSRDYVSVLRRTMDGISGHICLEIVSWKLALPSSA